MAFKEELEALMRLISSFKPFIQKEEDETNSDNQTESEESSEKEDE